MGYTGKIGLLRVDYIRWVVFGKSSGYAYAVRSVNVESPPKQDIVLEIVDHGPVINQAFGTDE